MYASAIQFDGKPFHSNATSPINFYC